MDVRDKWRPLKISERLTDVLDLSAVVVIGVELPNAREVAADFPPSTSALGLVERVAFH